MSSNYDVVVPDFEAKIRQFNTAYSTKNVKEERSFLNDFKATLAMIDTNVPTVNNLHAKTAKEVTKDLKQFTEIAKRSINQIHFKEKDAKEVGTLMSHIHRQLLNSTDDELKIIANEIEQTRNNISLEVKIGDIEIPKQIDEAKNKMDELQSTAQKHNILAMVFTATGAIGFVGSLALLPFILTVGWPVIVGLGVGMVVSFAAASFYNHSVTDSQEELHDINQRMGNLTNLKNWASEPDFLDFISKKNFPIQSLNDNELSRLKAFREEWERMRR